MGCVKGESERESGQEKKIFKKASSSPVAHPGEKEEQCCLKRHCFVFFFLRKRNEFGE